MDGKAQSVGTQGSGCLRPIASKTVIEILPMVVESEGFRTPPPKHSVSQHTAARTLPSSINLVNTLIKCSFESKVDDNFSEAGCNEQFLGVVH